VLAWPLIRPFAALAYETWLKLRAGRN